MVLSGRQLATSMYADGRSSDRHRLRDYMNENLPYIYCGIYPDLPRLATSFRDTSAGCLFQQQQHGSVDVRARALTPRSGAGKALSILWLNVDPPDSTYADAIAVTLNPLKNGRLDKDLVRKCAATLNFSLSGKWCPSSFLEYARSVSEYPLSNREPCSRTLMRSEHPISVLSGRHPATF